MKRRLGLLLAAAKRRRRWLLVALVLLCVCWVYIHLHPLEFISAHRHCIKIGGLQLASYADGHNGQFPTHPKGYGNALLLVDEDSFPMLTGPGYDAKPFHKAKLSGQGLAEEDCGRVYVQGLKTTSNSDIAILFDKLPTPGGDHCHLPFRLWARLGREVWLINCTLLFVLESEWPEFAKKQVELLVKEGFNRQEAERLYASKPSAAVAAAYK